MAEGTVCDIAETGASIQTLAALKPLDNICLRVLLPDFQPSLRVLLAAVRWVREEKIGLEFVAVPEEERKRLSQLLIGQLST